MHRRGFSDPLCLLRLSVVLLGALQVGLMLAVLEQPAQAYVDPGSGYMLLQVAGSMALGALYYLRHRVKRFVGLLRGKRIAAAPLPDEPISQAGLRDFPPHKADP